MGIWDTGKIDKAIEYEELRSAHLALLRARARLGNNICNVVGGHSNFQYHSSKRAYRAPSPIIQPFNMRFSTAPPARSAPVALTYRLAASAYAVNQ